ncbi:MAG: ATP-binding protein [Acidobacteria bacterium]|nr:ATP-binding protein [Acidobacteriota bacterium]
MIKRFLEKEIKSHLSHPEITILVGPRQVGKTTLLMNLKKELDRSGEKTMFLNLDIERDRIHSETQEHLVKKCGLEFGERKGFVFIDEIQRKENAALFLKGLFDMGFSHKLIVSGSGSLELKAGIHESLSGRKRLFELPPVTFQEFAAYKTGYSYEERMTEFFDVEKEQARTLLDEYLNFGGYPRIVVEPLADEKFKIMDELYRSYVEKDLIYWMRIDKPDAFIRMIQRLAASSSRILNHSRIASETGLSVPTLKNYLWYAEKTFIIRTLSPFFTNRVKEIVKAPAVYFLDTGLLNYAQGIYGSAVPGRQAGFTFQNWVCTRLLEKTRTTGWHLHYWRTTDKAEVDFVLDRQKDQVPIEVKFSPGRAQITRSLHAFIDKYKPAEAWVVNLNMDERIRIRETEVRFIPFYRL